jgi:Trp operon repressor
MLLNKVITYSANRAVSDNYRIVEALLEQGWIVKKILSSSDRGGNTICTATVYITVVLEKESNVSVE